LEINEFRKRVRKKEVEFWKIAEVGMATEHGAGNGRK
jgi:hypothetical protein